MKEVNRAGVTVLMVEQNTAFTLRIADTVHVMQKGEIVLSSPVTSLRDPTQLLEYLGVGALMSDRIRREAAARASAPDVPPGSPSA
ncbi:MAG: hypothetical protein HY775_04790 [Acidobacteria bacterium]|nr:hypothetical protein [Acidobacteriota bacterium]